MATLRETALRNSVASDMLGLETQANSAVDQLVANKTNLANIKKTMAANPTVFTAADQAEIDTIGAAVATRIRTQVLGG